MKMTPAFEAALLVLTAAIQEDLDKEARPEGEPARVVDPSEVQEEALACYMALKSGAGFQVHLRDEGPVDLERWVLCACVHVDNTYGTAKERNIH